MSACYAMMNPIIFALMKENPHISIRGLKYTYVSRNGHLDALSNVNLNVPAESFLSVIGPSGGGKTTLLKLIGGLLKPTSGSISLGYSNPHTIKSLGETGFVFQNPSLLPWKTVLQNICLPIELHHSPIEDSPYNPEFLLENVGLLNFKDYYPHQLSAGMLQRVSFARAMMVNPSILLMDEPLGALDEITRSEMRYEILRLWSQSPRTVVLVTHSIAEAILMSDKVAILSSRPGRVLHEIEINLERPRKELVEHSSAFLDYASQIKTVLSEAS